MLGVVPVRSRLLSLAVSRVYSIGVYTGPSPLRLSAPPGVPNPVLTPSCVTDAVSTSVADPFMIRVDGRWYMFFETVNWSSGSRRGEIAFATSVDGFRWQYQHVVLAEPFHLSYPHVFRHGSDHYMIPESHEAGSVRLYRASPFPHRWAFVATLLKGPVLVDTSVFEWDQRWWMLTETSSEHRHDTLRLFHATEPLGPWAEHPRSPIVTADPGSARPAGRVLPLPDRLIRFAQVCTPEYGSSVRAFEIMRLTVDDYSERPAAEAPVLTGSGRGWNRSGAHHVDAHPLDRDRWLACVDGWSATRSRQLLRWAGWR